MFRSFDERRFTDKYQTALQRQLRNGKPRFNTTWREYQALDLREHLLPTIIILQGKLYFSVPLDFPNLPHWQTFISVVSHLNFLTNTTQSIWSINDDLFSLRSLIITAILIALSTYVLVFNVNNIGKLLSILKRPQDWKLKPTLMEKTGKGDRNKISQKVTMEFDRLWTWVQFWKRSKRGNECVSV